MGRARCSTVVLLGAAVLLAGCGEPAGAGRAAPDGARPVVFAVNQPLATFARRLGGDLVDVRFPAPPGVDPADWMPAPDDLAAAQAADLILANGAGYAGWLEHASLPTSRLVVTAAGFADRWIERPDAVVHRHGPEGAHSHAGFEAHTWLDLDQAARQADAVAAALAALLPEAADGIEAARAELAAELAALDARWRAAAARDPGRPLLASHPVYGYLARRCGLDLESVHWEPDRDPGVMEWGALARRLEERPARTMLWEGEPLPEVAERLRALGVEHVVLDPGGGVPADGGDADFVRRMEANARVLEQLFDER